MRVTTALAAVTILVGVGGASGAAADPQRAPTGTATASASSDAGHRADAVSGRVVVIESVTRRDDRPAPRPRPRVRPPVLHLPDYPEGILSHASFRVQAWKRWGGPVAVARASYTSCDDNTFASTGKRCATVRGTVRLLSPRPVTCRGRDLGVAYTRYRVFGMFPYFVSRTVRPAVVC